MDDAQEAIGPEDPLDPACHASANGELSTQVVKSVFGLLEPALNEEDVVYDLGSGRGAAVFSVCLQVSNA